MIATAVAGLLIAGKAISQDQAQTPPPETQAKVKCFGVNECKAKGACGGATHDCAGKNECKGKGFIKLSAEECDKLGGTNKG